MMEDGQARISRNSTVQNVITDFTEKATARSTCSFQSNYAEKYLDRII